MIFCGVRKIILALKLTHSKLQQSSFAVVFLGSLFNINSAHAIDTQSSSTSQNRDIQNHLTVESNLQKIDQNILQSTLPQCCQ